MFFVKGMLIVNMSGGGGGRHGLVLITVAWQPGCQWFKSRGGKIFTFQILLLKRAFKSLAAFGENIKITLLERDCSLCESHMGYLCK